MPCTCTATAMFYYPPVSRAACRLSPFPPPRLSQVREYLDGFGHPYDAVGGNHDLEGIDEFKTDEENLEAYLRIMGAGPACKALHNPAEGRGGGGGATTGRGYHVVQRESLQQVRLSASAFTRQAALFGLSRAVQLNPHSPCFSHLHPSRSWSGWLASTVQSRVHAFFGFPVLPFELCRVIVPLPACAGKETPQFCHEVAEKTLVVGIGSTVFRTAKYAAQRARLCLGELVHRCMVQVCIGGRSLRGHSSGLWRRHRELVRRRHGGDAGVPF